MNYGKAFEDLLGPLRQASPSRAGSEGDRASSRHSPSQMMLVEAFRANGWQASVDALVAYTMKRRDTATPEDIKAMHDALQAACGELWKGIEP